MPIRIIDFLELFADLYIPALFIIATVVVIKRHTSNTYKFKYLLTYLAAIVAIVYLVRLVDQLALIWFRLGLDYSTHTALSLALCCHIIRNSYAATSFIVLTSLIWYCWLMYHLKYHSIGDMASTSLIILILNFLLIKYLGSRYKFTPISS